MQKTFLVIPIVFFFGGWVCEGQQQLVSDADDGVFQRQFPGKETGGGGAQSAVTGEGRRWEAGTHKKSILHGGLERSYRIDIPAGLGPGKKHPLVIALHGGGGTGEGMERLTAGGFNKLADKEGFIVVYPDGIERHWNDGRKEVSYRAHREKIDDTGFVAALIHELAEKSGVDLRRVYITGISNGGLMSFRLALELPEKIAAIAAVTASLPVEFKDAKPSRPVPVLLMNGTRDPLVPWQGGNIGFPRKSVGRVISTMETVKFWVCHNGCAPEPVKRILPDKDPADGTKVTVETYGGGKDHSEVILYRIEGGGHTWPGGWQYLPERIIGKTSREIDANETIWNFFKNCERNG